MNILNQKKEMSHLSFQDNSLFPHYTILDNINFGAKRNRMQNINFKAKELINFTFSKGLENKFHIKLVLAKLKEYL